VIIPSEKNRELIGLLRAGVAISKRKLQPYAVSLYWYELKNMIDRGIINDFGTGIYQLADSRYYDSKTGINPEQILSEIY
jgi:hypothetical protein